MGSSPILIVDTMPRIAGFNPIARLKNIFRGYERTPLEEAQLGGVPIDPLDERQVARFAAQSDTAQFQSGIEATSGTNRGWHERAHIGDTVNNKSVAYDPNWTQRGNSVGAAIPSRMAGNGNVVSDITADVVAQVRPALASSDRTFFAPPALVDPSQAPIRNDVNRGLVTANSIDITTDPQSIIKQRHVSGPVISITGDTGVTGVLLDELEEAGSTLRNGLRNPSGVTSPSAVKFKSVPGSYHSEVLDAVHPVNKALDDIGNGMGRIAGRVKGVMVDPVMDAGAELSEAVANKAAYNAKKFGGKVITPAAALAIGGTAIAGHTLFNKLRNRKDESSIN